MVIAGLSVTLLLIVFGRLETAPSRRATVTGLLTSIVRKQGRPDVLLPTACPSACQPLFRADEAAVPDGPLSGRCSCVCPRTAPVYLHTAGHCVDRLDECRYNLAFNSSVDTERLIPVVSLPAKNGVVFPKVPILWNSSGIIVSASNTVDCTVSEVFVDNVEHRWKAVSRRVLFDISTARGRPMVMFRGSDAEVTMLTGAVVQLKLSCNGFAADEHCLSFRVTGVSGAIPHVTPSSSSRVELLLICLLLFLLVLSIGGSLVLWQMCWRIKKQKLISTIQMQFLFHLQQQQEVRKVVETQAAVNDIGPCEFKTLMERIPKRRLYFSAEKKVVFLMMATLEHYRKLRAGEA
uniref:Protein kinase domain-containing protein n=1 Tax=Angiostrongylus cantonensis TaxID=6313 RepID=A0A158PA08_ANGCA